MNDHSAKTRSELPPELTDDDVYDAMGRLPGYLDITTDDFRSLYRLAYDHALKRLVGGLVARELMRPAGVVLQPRVTLHHAAELMAAGRLKSAPVCDERGLVLGVLSETDVLRKLGATTFLELVAQSPGLRADQDRLLRKTMVADVMSSPAATVEEDGGYEAILSAFRSHGGRRMPVVDRDGRLTGMLVRKDFLSACPLGFGADG